MPPDVPATVKAKVPEDVMGEPLTEIKPPVKLCATEVTVPVVGVDQDGTPDAKVKTWPFEPAASIAVAPAAL